MVAPNLKAHPNHPEDHTETRIPGPHSRPTELGYLEVRPRNLLFPDSLGEQALGRQAWEPLMRTPFPALLQMQVWDTAGQERFRTITQSYYRSAHAAIIAYDLTRRSTFESVPHWIHEIEKYGAANLVIMLIGMAFSKHLAFLSCLPLLMLSLYMLLTAREQGILNVQADGTSESVWLRIPIRST